MQSNEKLKTTIQGFQPSSFRSVTVWFHDTDNDEHYVGLATKVDVSGNSLNIDFEWILRVERDRTESIWKPIAKRKRDYHMTFREPVLKSKQADQIELVEDRDVINLYLGEDRLEEARKILERNQN